MSNPTRRRRLIETREQMAASIRARIEAGSEPDDNGCWLWMRSLSHAGYGRLQVTEPDGRSTAWGAHRAAYVAWIGEVPDGLHLDHLCRVRNCVNPAHLEPVTVRENLDRSPIAPATIHRDQTHCIHGHAFDEVNTYLEPSTGYRQCRTCKHDRTRAARAAAKRARGA